MLAVTFHFLGLDISKITLAASSPPAHGPAAAVGKVASASVVVGWLTGAPGVAPPSAGHPPVSSTATVMVSAAATAGRAIAAAAAAVAAAAVGSPSRG